MYVKNYRKKSNKGKGKKMSPTKRAYMAGLKAGFRRGKAYRVAKSKRRWY